MEALNTQLSPFFGWLVEASIQASVLIGLILLAKVILQDKLPIRWQYWLWALLLIRLVTPWMPKTKVSVFNFIPHTFQVQRTEFVRRSLQVTGTQSSAPQKTPIAQGKEALPVAPTVSEANLPKTAAPPSLPTVTTRPYKVLLRFVGLLPLIWLIGAGCLGGFILVRSFSLWRMVKGERPITDSQILELLEDCKMQMGIQTIVGVVVTDRVKGPALFGFVRPRLLLPEGLIEDLGLDQLYYVFIHELCHLKRRDVYLGWLISLLQILHWFNPLMWFALHRMRLDREFACDALAVSSINAEERPVYGRTILNLLEKFSQVNYVPSIAGILEDSSQIER